MSIEEKIRQLLEEADQKSAAQLAYPGASKPQDPIQVMQTNTQDLDLSGQSIGSTEGMQQAQFPAPGVAVEEPLAQTGINIEVLEFDRPGVDFTREIPQVQFPGQTVPDPEPYSPEYEELDPYDPASDIVPNAEKESYPVGSGANDVVDPASVDPNADAGPDQFSRGIKPAAHPAPFVAEATEDKPYKRVKVKNYKGYHEGKIVEVEQVPVSKIENKLGLKPGTLNVRPGEKYSDEVTVKGTDGKLHTIYTVGKTARIRAYAHDDNDSTDSLKKHLMEAAVVGQEDDDQEQMIQQAIAAVKAGNPVEDVAKAIGVDPKVLQDLVDANEPTQSPPASTTTAPVSESQFKEDVDNLLAEETLSEEFKAKAASLFEAAVIARVNDETSRINEAYESKLNEQVEQLKEQYVEAVNNFAEKQSSRLNNYINYLGEQWIKQNKVAVQQGIRTEIAEGFITGLHKLFLEHNINVPEEKFELVEEQKTEIQNLKESIETMKSTFDSLQEELKSQISDLQESNQSLQRDAVITKLSEGLTYTESEKLHTLCEGIDFENEDIFEEKVKMIKNNFFKKSPVKSPEELLESTIINNQSHEEPPVNESKFTDVHMQKYVEALDRMKKF